MNRALLPINFFLTANFYKQGWHNIKGMGFLGKTNGSTAARVNPFAAAGAMGVQTKLNISKASDPAEKEADTVAREVVEEQKDKKESVGKKGGDEKEKGLQKSSEKMDEEQVQAKGMEEEEEVQAKGMKEDEVQKKGNEEEDQVQAKDIEKDKVQAKSKEEEKGLQKKEMPEKEKAAVQKKNTIQIKEANDKKPVEVEKEQTASPTKIHRKLGTANRMGIQQKPAVAARAAQQTETDEKEKGNQSDEKQLAALEHRIDTRRGNGHPLPQQLKAEMESSFGSDFSEVNIHTDQEAIELCNDLNAQAFAIGNDIFFNAGKYDPESEAGKELLAHELTHVVQQKDHIHRKTVMRNPTPPAGGAAATTGTVNGDVITISSPPLSLPSFKGVSHRESRYGGKIRTKKNYNRDAATAGTASQTALWDADVTDAVTSKINDLTEAVPAKPQNPNNPNLYYFKNENVKIFGTKESLIENTKRPLWNKDGNISAYDVDHILELQLEGGENEINNLELLNFSANRGSGSLIASAIRRHVEDFLATPEGQATNKSTAAAAMTEYTIEFDNRSFDRESGTTAKGADFWELSDIKSGTHLNDLTPMTTEEVEATTGVNMDPTAFTAPIGGAAITAANSRMPGTNLDVSISRPDTSTATDAETVGRLTGTLFHGSRMVQPLNLNIPLYGMPGVAKGGYIARRDPGKQGLESVLRRLNFLGLSPVTIDTCDIVPGVGIVASGRIEPTVEIIEGLYIDFDIEGDRITLSRTFTANDIIGIPPPLKVTEAGLRVFAEGGANAALGIEGNINFEVTNVGTGVLSASANSAGTFRLNGNFDFDERLFGGVRARVAASYEHTEGQEDQWSLEGDVRIPAGKIPGIQNANINVSYANRVFSATGDARFDIPGLQDGTLSVTYAEEQLLITGEANFNHRMIRSGQVRARVEMVGDETNLLLEGTARPNIPGVDTELAVTYDNGAITVTGSVAYSRGRLSGSVTLGVTNQSVGADGQPSGAPGNDLIAFGSGTLSLTITPWLQGSATVTLLPDGNMEVVGRIGIPDTVDIFPKKEIEKELFRAPTLEIPLFAIPVGPRSIGLVATIGGGAQAYASIGPGQLTQAEVEVQYNPAREEDLSVTGRATFRVPAEAGIRLSVRAGIGLSVGIARVGGGIEIGGALGIEGAAEAGVEVNWTPTAGFTLDAEANIRVQPKFKFDVTAYLEAVLDLYITEFRAEYRKELYAFEWGPSMTFGVRFPVHYAENEPFDISLDQVEFEAPDINVADFARGIGEQLF